MVDYLQQFIESTAVLTPLPKSWFFWLKHKKNDLEKFRLAVETILVQQSNWKNVEQACNNLKNYWNRHDPKIDPWDYAWYSNVNIEVLQNLIKPTGFYKQKSIHLKDLANHWLTIKGKTSFIERRKALLEVKGIGDESADAILLYAFEELTFLVDAFTLRIIQRAQWFSQLNLKSSMNYKLLKELFLIRGINPLFKDIEWFQWLHAYFVTVGQEFCLPKDPNCFLCSLKLYCNFGNSFLKHDG